MRRTPQAAGGGAAAEAAVEGGAWGCGLYARMARSRPVWAICAASGPPGGARPCSPFRSAAHSCSRAAADPSVVTRSPATAGHLLVLPTGLSRRRLD